MSKQLHILITRSELELTSLFPYATAYSNNIS